MPNARPCARENSPGRLGLATQHETTEGTLTEVSDAASRLAEDRVRASFERQGLMRLLARNWSPSTSGTW